jgi:hypothetical protein
LFIYARKYSLILKLYLLDNPLGLVVLLGELLVSQELGVHSSGGNVLGALLLLDAVGVSLVRVVVRAGVLLLLGFNREGGGRFKKVRRYIHFVKHALHL